MRPGKAAGAALLAMLLGATALPAHAEPTNDPPPDITGPNIFVDAPASPWEGWYGDAVDITMRATDPSGVESVSYSLTGAQTGAGEGFNRVTARIAQQGVTSIAITAVDTEGNASTRQYAVGVDLSDPTIELGGTIANGATVRQGDVRTFTYTCADAPTGVASCTTNRGIASGGAVPTDDVGEHTIVVTAADRVGRARQRAISYTVAMRRLQITSGPTVSGYVDSPRIGDVLHANGATFTPAAHSVTYRWVLDGVVVASGPDYTVTAADLGKFVAIQVVGHREGYQDTVWGNAIIGEVLKTPFAVTGAARLTGTPREGETLRIEEPASVTPAPTTTTYHWTVGDDPVEGSSPALVLTAAHIGQRVSCYVRYESPTHTATVPCTLAGGADATAPVIGLRWDVLTRTAIKGRARPGKVLRALAPTLSGTPDTLTYLWLRNGEAITGSTKTTYRVRRSDRGERITVRVTARTEHRPSTVSTSKTARVR